MQTGKSPIECCINELNFILTSDDDNKKVLLSSVATHVAVTVDEFDDQNIDVSIKILNKYLELEPVGPFIAGDLVLQGYSLEPNYAPAVCKIEFLSNSDETGDYQELSTIMPWEMIYQPGDNEGNPDSFAIPITLPSDNLEGTAHLTVYVDIASNTPHNEPSSSYLPDNPQLIAAIDFFTPVSSHPQDMTPRPVEEEKMSANQRSYQVITSIKSSSYHQSEALLHGNYLTPCPCIDMINGFQQTPDEEHDWKFVIAIEQNDENTHLHGLEDAMFVVRDKDTGDFDLPEGYELDSSNLLADIPNMVIR